MEHKKDSFTDADERALYKNYAEMDLEAFRENCKKLISSSFGKDETKMKFLRILSQEPQQHKILSTTINYFYAGKGLKV